MESVCFQCVLTFVDPQEIQTMQKKLFCYVGSYFSNKKKGVEFRPLIGSP